MNSRQQLSHPRHLGDEPESELDHYSEQDSGSNLAQDVSERLEEKIREHPLLSEGDNLARLIFATHPIFQVEKDMIFSPLIQALNSLKASNVSTYSITEKINDISSHIFQYVFEGKKIPQLKAEFEELGLSKKTTCGKLLSLGDLCFRCLDCEKEVPGGEMASVFCAECFENSNHKGHRALVFSMTSTQTGFCDCGDDDLLNSEGFCPDHQRNDIFHDEILSQFPRNIVKNCKEILNKAFYGITSFFEIAQVSKENLAVKVEIELFGEVFLALVLKFIETCYSEISIAFIPLFSNILQSQLKSPYNKLWHNCENISGKTKNENIPRECVCTIIGNLFRFITLIPEFDQTTIKKILLECLKGQSFKEFFIPEYMKYAQCLFPNAFAESITTNPSLNFVAIQMPLSNKEEYVIQALNSPYFMNYLAVMKGALITYTTPNFHVLRNLSGLQDVFTYLLNPTYKQAMEKLLTETDFTKQIMDILVLYKNLTFKADIHIGCSPIAVPIESISIDFIAGKVISFCIERVLQPISQCPFQEKITFLMKIFKEWYDNIDAIEKVINQKSRLGALNFNSLYERLLGDIIRTYQSNFTAQSIETFLDVVMPGKSKSDFAQRIMKNTLKALGYMRFIHVVHDYNMEEVRKGYYHFQKLLFEGDIVLIQMMTVLHKPENLFETLTQNFFSYDQNIMKFFQSNQSLEKNDLIK